MEALEGGIAPLAEPTSGERHEWLAMLGSWARWLETGVQVSAGAGQAIGARGTSSAGRVVLRWRVSGQHRRVASAILQRRDAPNLQGSVHVAQ
jgi:hypothetical protein